MRAFVYLGVGLIYIAYLDEFGHVGPYVVRRGPRRNDSSVFGFAGFLMSAEEVRAFGTWFFSASARIWNTSCGARESTPRPGRKRVRAFTGAPAWRGIRRCARRPTGFGTGSAGCSTPGCANPGIRHGTTQIPFTWRRCANLSGGSTRRRDGGGMQRRRGGTRRGVERRATGGPSVTTGGCRRTSRA